jgi:pilus assembly protein CpaE
VIYRLTIDGFHLTPEVAAALDELRVDRRFAKSRVALMPGGLPAAVAHYADNGSPQVVIVEEGDDDQAMLSRLAQLAEVCLAGTRVIVIGRLNDIGVYRTLLTRGVSEYLIPPVSAEQIAGAIAAMFADPSSTSRGRLIAFFGARGGVGSSTLAHNTAWCLARATAEEVVVADLDLAFGTLALAFNVDTRQTVGDLLGDPDRIDAQLIDRLALKHDARLHLLPSPSDLRDWPAIEVETIDRLFDLLRQVAAFAVVDLPHLWTPWISHSLETADELVVVAQPDLPNLRDAKTLFDGVGQRRDAHLPTHLVLNKVDAYRKTQLLAKDFEETLKVRPALSLPFDPIFGQASNNGQMLGDLAKTHKAVQSLEHLARLVGGRPEAPRRRPRLGMLTAWLKTSKPAK